MKYHSLPPSAEIKNKWNYTSTPPYFFLTCTGINLPVLSLVCTKRAVAVQLEVMAMMIFIIMVKIKGKICGACSVHGINEMRIRILTQKPWGIDRYSIVKLEQEDNVRTDCREMWNNAWTGFVGLRYRVVVITVMNFQVP